MGVKQEKQKRQKDWDSGLPNQIQAAVAEKFDTVTSRRHVRGNLPGAFGGRCRVKPQHQSDELRRVARKMVDHRVGSGVKCIRSSHLPMKRVVGMYDTDYGSGSSIDGECMPQTTEWESQWGLKQIQYKHAFPPHTNSMELLEHDCDQFHLRPLNLPAVSR